MQPRYKQPRAKQQGATTVEFALGVMVLLVATFAIFESCYQIYVVNMTEYSLRETIRNTKLYQAQGEERHQQYEATFNALIRDDSKLWHFLIDANKFSIEGSYFKSYADFINGVGTSSELVDFGYDLAEISVSYAYTPMINLWGAADSTITRTMVLNLEHEGWEDETE